jgi:hypothetical protein
VFKGCAHADSFPHEAFGLALVESGHDFFAAWETVIRKSLDSSTSCQEDPPTLSLVCR